MTASPERSRAAPETLASAGLFVAFQLSLVGFALAWILDDPIFAGRFGSLIVCYGLGFLAFMRWYYSSRITDEELWEERLRDAVKLQTGSNYDVRNRIFFQGLSKYGEYIRNKYLFYSEITIIGYGTLIWGFGDIIAIFINSAWRP